MVNLYFDDSGNSLNVPKNLHRVTWEESSNIRILIRLPNWLGDLVMSSAFVHELRRQFPKSHISIVVKEEYADMAKLMVGVDHFFLFSKKEYKGLPGLVKFGLELRKSERFDLFFCLPDSFSSAFIGWLSGSKKRIGHRSQMRRFLLTHSCRKPSKHRVEQYFDLIEKFVNSSTESPVIELRVPSEIELSQPANTFILNFNSEASSRRMPFEHAAKIADRLVEAFDFQFVLIGSPKEKPFVNEIIHNMKHKADIVNLAGKTSLLELASLLSSATGILSTDSGPAHLANSLGTKTFVFIGAADWKHTAPYNEESRKILKLNHLSCSPCFSNRCRFSIPKCLTEISTNYVVESVRKGVKDPKPSL